MVAGILEYAAVAIVYSLLAAVVLETLLYLWRVQAPPLALAFRLPVLAIPPLAPLLFPLLGVDREAESFRGQVALLDLRNWLGHDPSPLQPGWAVLLALMAITTLLVALEVSSFVSHLLSRRRLAHHPLPPPKRLEQAWASVADGKEAPAILVVRGTAPTAYTIGLWRPAILASTALVDKLDDEELQCVLAHEMAHAGRRDNWLGWLVFLFRCVSFYNPVSLFVSHQIHHDVERVCDWEAAQVTGKPLAMASALLKVYGASRPPATAKGLLSRFAPRGAAALEHRARRALVEDRVRRLVHPARTGTTSYPALRLSLAVAGVLALAYLVV